MTSTYLQALMNNENSERNADVIFTHWYEDCVNDIFNLAFYLKAFEIIFLKAQGRYLDDSYFTKLIDAIECRLDDAFKPLLADMHYCLNKNGLKADFNRVIGLERRLRNIHEELAQRGPNISDEQIEDALFTAQGNVAFASDILNCHDQTVRKRIYQSAHLRGVLLASMEDESC